MRKLGAVVALCLVIVSCRNGNDSSKFRLTGELKNITDQKIYLEQLYFSQKEPSVLDSASIKNGKFELSSVVKEEGLFRLRLEKLEHGFIFINDKADINFKADLNDVSLDGPVFNSPANSKLKKLMVDINEKIKAMSEASSNMEKLTRGGGSDSLIAIESTRLDELADDYKSYIINYIDTTSDPVIAMFALGYTRNMDPQSLKEVIPGLSKRFPKHDGIASIVSQYDRFLAEQKVQQATSSAYNANAIKPGSTAPELKMNDVNGKPYSWNNLKGKYVLIDFWASWCGPCRGENPNVVRTYNKYKDKNFTILGVSLDDDKSAWIKAIKDDGLSWPQVSDLKGWDCAAKPLYGFDAVPFNVLVDPQGKIIAVSLRGESLDNTLSGILK